MDINVQMSKSEPKMQGSNDIELYIANGLLGFEHEGYFIKNQEVQYVEDLKSTHRKSMD